jgi:hypothetical protein
MSTFKDIVLQTVDEVKENTPNVYTYEELNEKLKTFPKTCKVNEVDEISVDFVNVNIDKLIDLVTFMKERLEPYGLMNSFCTQDLIDIIHKTVRISEVPEDTSEEENDIDDDETLLDP